LNEIEGGVVNTSDYPAPLILIIVVLPHSSSVVVVY
jgi:hypothetical protein